MKKYIELKIVGPVESIASFVERLEVFSSDAFKFSEIREDNVLLSGYYLELQAKRILDYRSRVILFWNKAGIRISNIIPKTVPFLELEQYNSVLRHFYEDVILALVDDSLTVAMSKEDNSMRDLISSPAYNALELWEELCDKNAPTSHPNDRERWMDFISELYINGDHLSLSDFRNWLIDDRGWYFDVNDEGDRTFIDLEIELEFGLDLLEHYAKKTQNR